MRVCFTGHRKLPKKSEIYRKVTETLEKLEPSACICGGSWGADFIFAKACISLNIPLYVILPFPFKIFTARWSYQMRQQLASILSKAKKVYYVSPHFDISAYHQRNEIIVQLSDVLIAVYDGRTSGGTKNTVLLAQKKGIPILRIDPRSPDLAHLKPQTPQKALQHSPLK